MKKLILATVLLLSACTPESNIKPTIDRTERDITVRVIFHENRESLEEAYRTINLLEDNIPIPEQWGFAKWNEWRDRQGNYIEPLVAELKCEIHTFRPKNQDDQLVLTMGHELLHCVHGSYHK